MDVLIYTTPTCGYCHQAKEYLRSRNVAFVEKNVAVDAVAAQEMVQRSGQRGVPVLIMDGEVIVGFDRRRIDAILSRGVGGAAKLGASVADAAGRAAKAGLAISQGAYVGRVNAGSVAERAGLRAGDVLLALAGQTVHTAEDVQRIVRTLRAGQQVPALVWREGRQVQFVISF